MNSSERDGSTEHAAGEQHELHVTTHRVEEACLLMTSDFAEQVAHVAKCSARKSYFFLFAVLHFCELWKQLLFVPC